MAWIRTQNLKQNGTPVTRRIRIPDMDQAVWFTTEGYSEVDESVATLLSNNVEPIIRVEAPDTPGDYYGEVDGQQEMVVLFPREDRYVDDLDTNSITIGGDGPIQGIPQGSLDENGNFRVEGLPNPLDRDVNAAGNDVTNVGQMEADDVTAGVHTEPTRELKTKSNNFGRFMYRGHQISDFSDPAEWIVGGGSLTTITEAAMDGTEEPLTGSESGHWTSPGENDLTLKYEFDNAVDMTKWCPDVAFRRKTPVQTGINFDIVSTDINGNTAVGGRTVHGIGVYHDPESNPDTTTEWRRLPGGFGIVNEQGFKPELVESITIRLRANQDLHPVDVHLDDFRLVPRPDKGYVCLLFDDGDLSQFTEGFTYANKHNMVGVVGLHTQLIENGSANHMTPDQIEIMSDHGWEFISHNPNQTDTSGTLTPEEWAQKLDQSKRWLLDHGHIRGARSHIYPSWRVDDEIRETTGQYHEWAGSMGINGRPPAMPITPTTLLDYPRIYDFGNSLNQQKSYVDTLAEYGGVGVWAIHDIGNEQFTVAEYQELIDHIASKGDQIETITTSDIIDMATNSGTMPRPETTDEQWTLDGALTIQADNSGTYTIGKSADMYKLVIGGESPRTLGNSPINMRLNGLSDARYDYKLEDDTDETMPEATTELRLVELMHGHNTNRLCGEIKIYDADPYRRTVVSGDLSTSHTFGTINHLDTGWHRDVLDLTSFELQAPDVTPENGFIDLSVEVYRRDYI